jgi:hypothetical protein
LPDFDAAGFYPVVLTINLENPLPPNSSSFFRLGSVECGLKAGW